MPKLTEVKVEGVEGGDGIDGLIEKGTIPVLALLAVSIEGLRARPKMNHEQIRLFHLLRDIDEKVRIIHNHLQNFC